MPQPPRGTFADLYDTEQRVTRTRAGRPRRTVKRKQVTLYLTPNQEEALTDLHYVWKKRVKVDRSDIAGLAIFLSSRAGAFTVGETITCDGGAVACS